MPEKKHPSIAALRQFVEIQDAGGIARAARNLGLTQPALSRNIKRLEATVGVPLLDRHSRGTDLTPAGQSFYKHASRLILELEYGLEDARRTAGLAGNELRIGAGAVFAHSIVPIVLPVFESALPSCRVTVKTIAFEAIEDVLSNRTVDICMHGIPENRSGALNTRTIHDAGRSILCAPGHPLMAETGKVTVPQIARFPFVSFAPDREQMRDLDRLFREHRQSPPRITLETDLLSGALNVLRHGTHLMYGSSLLAEFANANPLAILPTEFTLGRYQIGLSHLGDSELGYGGKRFVSIVEATLKQRR